jgi:Sec-independent protein translocase protein TatA
LPGSSGKKHKENAVKVFNIGVGEILFIIILAVIIFGPENMVKSAREMGVFLRKVTKSPYWQEVWATRRDLEEIPKMLAKEANLKETMRELELDTKGVSSQVSGAVTDLINEVDGKTTPHQDKPANPAEGGANEAPPKEPPNW